MIRDIRRQGCKPESNWEGAQVLKFKMTRKQRPKKDWNNTDNNTIYFSVYYSVYFSVCRGIFQILPW